jgi:hypothetical protein
MDEQPPHETEAGLRGRATDSQSVAAPLERVVALAAQVEQLPAWHPFFVEVHDATGPLTLPGVTFRAVLSIGNRRCTVGYMVADSETPGQLILVGAVEGGGRLVWSRLFERSGSGSVVRGQLDYELPATFAADLAERVFMEWAIARDVRHSLEYFAALAEVREQVARGEIRQSTKKSGIPDDRGATPSGSDLARE